MDTKKIGKFIAENRKAKKLTQQQLAESLGVTNKTVSRWENGNYMPDLSLLTPLSRELGITLNELLSGEKIEGNVSTDKAEETLKKTVDYSKKLVSRMKIKLTAAVIAFIVIFAGLLAVFDIIHFTPGAYHSGDVAKWAEGFPNHSAYALALNGKNQPVFINPKKALAQAKIDYSDAISALKKEYKLLPLSKYTYKTYETYGWQIETDDKMVKEQGSALTRFFDVYENSFE